MTVSSTDSLPRLDAVLYGRPAGRNIIDFAIEELRRLRAERDALSEQCQDIRAQRNAAQAERDALRAALGEIAANRCGLCGIVTETPCKHEGDWTKCPNKHEPFRFNPRAIAKAALAARGKDE